MIDGAMLVSTEMSHGIVHFLIMSKHMYPKVDRRKICWGNHSKRKSSHRPKCTVLSIFKKMAELQSSRTYAHLEHPDDYCKFHLERVEVVKFVACLNPSGIQSEWVNTSGDLIHVALMISLLCVATPEDIQRNREEVVVYPASEERESTHHQH
jgi:hypothetical protein